MGGTLLVRDASPALEMADALSRMEKLRDPSHAHALLLFFFKQKTPYEIGLGIPAEPLFRSPHRHVYGEQCINTILHELNPLFTINVTMRDIKSKNVYSRDRKSVV